MQFLDLNFYMCVCVGGAIGHEVRNGTMKREEGIFRRVEDENHVTKKQHVCVWGGVGVYPVRSQAREQGRRVVKEKQ